MKNKKIFILGFTLLILIIISLNSFFVSGASLCDEDSGSYPSSYCTYGKTIIVMVECIDGMVTKITIPCSEDQVCSVDKGYAECVDKTVASTGCIRDVHIPTPTYDECTSFFGPTWESVGTSLPDTSLWRVCVDRDPIAINGIVDVELYSSPWYGGVCTAQQCPSSEGWDGGGEMGYDTVCYRLCKKRGLSNIRDIQVKTCSGSTCQITCPSEEYVVKMAGPNPKSNIRVGLCVLYGTCLPACQLRDESFCEAEGINSDCRWCPTPTDQENYPYAFPGYDSSKTAVCVNTTWDPLNCGGCGFSADGKSTLYNPDKTGFCPSNSPYCVNGVCKSNNQVKSDWKQVQIPASLTNAGDFNPVYRYEVKTDSNGAYYSEWYNNSGVVIGQTQPIYITDDIDSNSDICKKAAGSGADFIYNPADTLPDLGCCGDKKCREKTGTICNPGAICDGAEWHYVSNPDQQGEIFTLPDCTEESDNFPIANINNAFVRCVDDDRKEDYIALYNYPDGPGFCSPSNEGTGIVDGLAGRSQYACGLGSYGVGEFTASSDNVCSGYWLDKTEVTRSSDVQVSYVCDVKSSAITGNTFAFASIVDAGSNGVSTIGLDEGREAMTYENCPATITTSWETEDANPVSTVAILPCPGKIDLNDIILSNSFTAQEKQKTWGFSLGREHAREISICRPALSEDQNDKPWIYRPQTLKYFWSNGSIMGSVNEHSYVCYTNPNAPSDQVAPRAEIGVCCGNKTRADCDEDIPGGIGGGGKRYFAGDSINASGRILYCLNNGDWGFDLDKESLQGACSKAGFSATGTYCCSEWDDTITLLNESYNDPGSETGACFKGVDQHNDNYLLYNDVTYMNVFVSNGSFYGCGFNHSMVGADSEGLCEPNAEGILSARCLHYVEDWPNPGTGGQNTKTGNPLIKRAGYCTIINSGHGSVYCAFTNNWTDTLGENLSHISVVPESLLNYFKNTTNNPELNGVHCCMPSMCWDPSANACIPEQLGAADYYRLNENTVYKCLGGEWVAGELFERKTPDGCNLGYCPEANQCLYNLHGNPNDNNNVTPSANPQCIADGQYIGDTLCINGAWASRTKLLALELASLVNDGDNFVLMCEPPDEALIKMQNPGASNNFCVLNHNGQRIIGTTLNQPLVDSVTHNDFITALEQSFLLSYPDAGVSFSSSCSESTDNFEKCVDNALLKLYYDADYKMVVFSDGYIGGLSPSFGDMICNLLPSWLKWLCPSPSGLEKNLEGLQLFNKIYAAKSGSKSVFGIGEEACDSPISAKKWRYSFNYTGFTELGYLVHNIAAENATITQTHNNILIINPDPNIDVWTALTLLRNTEQE